MPWEWSLKNKKKPALKKESPLLSVYTDLLIADKKSATEPQTSLNAAQMLHLLESRAQINGLKNISFIKKNYEPQTWAEMKNSIIEYQRTRAAFIKMLTYSHVKELQQLGLTDFDINLMKQGITPENFNTHLKVPFDFGGACDFNNLCLIKTHPDHDYIHDLIDVQIENSFLKETGGIFIPHMEGKIYGN